MDTPPPPPPVRLSPAEEIEKLAAEIGIGSLSHLSEGRAANADVLKQAHAALRAYADLLRRVERLEKWLDAEADCDDGDLSGYMDAQEQVERILKGDAR